MILSARIWISWNIDIGQTKNWIISAKVKSPGSFTLQQNWSQTELKIKTVRNKRREYKVGLVDHG